MILYLPMSELQVESPVKKIHVALPESCGGPKNVIEDHQPGKADQQLPEVANGLKRKRPLPEIPPKGIFSSGLFSVGFINGPIMSPPRPNKVLLLAEETVKKVEQLEPPRLVKERLVQNLVDKVDCIMATNDRRCNACPLYGKDLVEAADVNQSVSKLPHLNPDAIRKDLFSLYDMGNSLVPASMHDLLTKLKGFMSRFHMYVPKECIKKVV
jgi:hypothetical protein